MGALPQVQVFGVPDNGHHQAVPGLYGNTDVDRFELGDDLTLIIKVRITLREFLHHLHQGLHEKRQVSEFCLVFLARPVQVPAQLLQFGDIDFFNVGKVRDTAGAQGHLFGYFAAHAYQFDFARTVQSRCEVIRRRCSGLLQKCVDIGTDNSTVRTRTLYLGKVDITFPGQAADGWGR